MIAIDDNEIAGVDPLGRALDPADRRHVERARDDRDMRRRRAFFEHQTHDAAMGIVEQFGRSHRARDEDEFGRQLARHGFPRRRRRKVALQAVGKVFEINEPLTQIRIARLHHAAAGLVADLLDCRLGGQTAADGIGDSSDPAAIGREHPVGFEDVPMLAGAEPITRRDQLVDRIAHRRDRMPEAFDLGSDILGDDLMDQQARLVQHRRTDRQPGVEPNTREPDGEHSADLAFRDFARIDEFAAGYEFGNDHRDRLQYLDLVVVIIALRTVLNNQHAKDAPTAQDRHAHQRSVDLLAGFRPVGEGRVCLRIGQRQRARGGCNQSDQALSDAQSRAMDGFRPQPLGSKKLEHLAGAHRVDRRDLGDHLRGDNADDTVQPFLRRAGTRHRVAQAPQQAAGSADNARGLAHLSEPRLSQATSRDGPVV